MLKRSILSILGGMLLAAPLAFSLTANAACGGLCPDKDPKCPDGGRFDSCAMSYDSTTGREKDVKCYYTCVIVVDGGSGPGMVID